METDKKYFLFIRACLCASVAKNIYFFEALNNGYG
jgi:hypothetical protein